MIEYFPNMLFWYVLRNQHRLERNSMAKIIQVGSQNLTPNKIANPFKTSRGSSTNPFKFNNFEGTTLPFELSADVFESKKSSKLRMIASSVTGSMNKMRSGLSESVINFVNRIRGGLTNTCAGVSNAWKYAASTNFSTAMSDAVSAIKDNSQLQQINEVLNTPIHIPAIDALSDRMASLRGGISSRMEFLNTDVTDIGRAMADKWTVLLSKVKSNKISADTPVCELREMWIKEIELGGAAA